MILLPVTKLPAPILEYYEKEYQFDVVVSKIESPYTGGKFERDAEGRVKRDMDLFLLSFAPEGLQPGIRHKPVTDEGCLIVHRWHYYEGSWHGPA